MPRQSQGPRYYPSKAGWFANIGGRRIRLVTGKKDETKSRAWELFREELELYNDANLGQLSPTYVVFNEFYTYLLERVDPHPISPNTARWMMRFLESFLGYFGDLPIREINTGHVERWWVLAKKDGSNWGQTTRRMATSTVRQAMDWAVRNNYLKSNQLRGLKVSRNSSVRSSNISDITEDEFFQVVQLLTRWRNKSAAYICAFLWGTGARPGEILQAKRGEWSERDCAIIIQSEGAEGRYKNRRKFSRRVVYVPDHLADLARLLNTNRKNFWFPNQNGKPYTANGFYMRLKRVTEKLGLRDTIVPYSFRHAFVTRWIKSGKDIATLAELLDTSPTMIQTHYSHLFEDTKHLRDALND